MLLNIFPDLLTFSLIAPLLIRLAVGGYFLIHGWALLSWRATPPSRYTQDVPQRYWLSLLSIAGAVLVLVGAWTQLGALVLSILSLIYLYGDNERRVRYILLLAMALSLLFSGAGFLAFDLPL